MRKLLTIAISLILTVILIFAIIGNSYAVSSFTSVSPFDKKNYTHYGAYSTSQIKDMIDVSEHNGLINFYKIKSLGIDDVIIRVGCRGYGSAGNIIEDDYYYDNIENAIDAGLNIGLYFYSQSLSVQEATAEAQFCLKRAADYKAYINLPIFFDYEFAGVASGRLDKAWNNGTLNKTKMTNNTIAFCDTIRAAGFKTGVYASASFFTSQLNSDKLYANGYEIWNAYYTTNSTAGSYWTNKNPVYRYWQYSASPNVQGCCGDPSAAWLKVTYNKQSGYVLSTFIDFTGATSGVSITDGVNLRKGAGTGYDVVAKIPFAGKLSINKYPTGTRTDVNFYYNTSLTRPEKPVFRLASKANSVSVSWNPVVGASFYRVYSFDTQSQKYKKLTQTGALSYTYKDLKNNTRYTFLVRAFASESLGSKYTQEDNLSIVTAPERPTFSVTPTSTSATVEWKAVTGADFYRVYQFSEEKDAFVRLTQTTALQFTHTGLEKAKEYTYLVRAFNNDGSGSGYTSADSITVLTAPQKPDFSLSAAGTRACVKWKAVNGASFYRVYSYDPILQAYTRLTQTTQTSFEQSGLKTNTKYTYLVRAFFADGGGSTYTVKDNKSVQTAPRAPKPAIDSRRADSIVLSWNPVEGAAFYRVYQYDVSADTYKRIAQTPESSVSLASLESGSTYIFLVRAFNASSAGSDYSEKDRVSAATLPASPSFSLKAGSESVLVRWNAVKGASYYKVFVYNSTTGKYTTLTQTEKSSWEYLNLKPNTAYTFLVRAYDKDGGGSPYKKASNLTVKTLPAKPVFTLREKDENTVVINWSKAAGAAFYRVYLYDKGLNKYTRLVQTEALSYSYKKAAIGGAYSFLVRAYDSAGNGSSYTDAERKSITLRLEKVDFTATSPKKGNLTISWSRVPLASFYRIYFYDAASAKYTRAAQTTALSYTFTGLVSGREYTVLVRAGTASGKLSAYTKSDNVPMRIL